MKKRLLSVALAVVMAVCLVGCSAEEMRTEQVENANRDMKSPSFVCIESSTYFYIVYHKETKVMYVVSDGTYNKGTFTPLYNADGTLQIYEESED